MTPAQLKAIGQKIYGNRWQTRLAREIGVAPSTVRKWLAGTHKIRKPNARAIEALRK